MLIACRAGLTGDHAARVVSADNIAVWKRDKIAVWKGNDMDAKFQIERWQTRIVRRVAPLVAPAPSTKSAIFNHLRCPQRFDLRFFRPLAADLSIRKVSSVFPSLIAAFNHLGVAPRPAQVSPSGLRYFGGTFFPFNALPRPLRAIFPPSDAIEPPSAANCFSSVVRCPDRALSTCVRQVDEGCEIHSGEILLFPLLCHRMPPNRLMAPNESNIKPSEFCTRETLR